MIDYNQTTYNDYDGDNEFIDTDESASIPEILENIRLSVEILSRKYDELKQKIGV